MTSVEPTRDQVLEFCAHDPVERVFLEDAARRGFGRFAAVANGDGDDHGAVPQRREPRAVGRRLRGLRAARGPLAGADDHRRGARGRGGLARRGGPAAAGRARTGRASRSTRSTSRRRPARPGCAPATQDDLEILVPACAAAHELELGIDPLSRDADGVPLADVDARSRKDARGCGSRTASCCSRRRRRRGRPARCSSRRSGPIPEARGHGYATRGLRRPLPAAARLGAGRYPVRPQRERRRRSGCTRRWGCGRCSSTGACCFETDPQVRLPALGRAVARARDRGAPRKPATRG